MDSIIVQSGDFSFDEFAKQHANVVKLIPVQHGLDGAVIFSVMIPITYDLIKLLVKYLNKKKKEKEFKQKLDDGKEHGVRIFLPNDIVIEFPVTGKQIETEALIKEIKDGLNQA